MEPTKPFPHATVAAVPYAECMAGVGPLRAYRDAVKLRPALLATGGALALVAGAWVVWTACQDAPSGRGAGSTPDHRRLVALMRSERPFEPRLAGGFDHAPCTVTPHGENRLLPGPGCGQEGLQAATLDRLRKEQPGYSSTSDPHARGVWRLFWGQGAPESLAGAVADLRNAASAHPGPERWNDLAAALIVEARLAHEPALLVEALDWVTRILEQEPTYPEALYNRALLLADLGLGPEAREAWQRYLDAEIDPAWREEAEGRLGASHEPEDADLLMDRLAHGDVAAVAPAVARDSEAVRKLALNRLFAVWSAAVASGDLPRAAVQLDLLRIVGSELRSATGDHLVADAVAAIDRSRQVPTLARAHDDLIESRRLMGESRYTEAYERLEAARERFRRAGSPLDGWAELWLAVCDSSTNRWGRALDRVAAVQARDDLAAYPVLDARSRWTRGLIELRSGDYEASLATFLAVAALFRAMGEPALEAAATALSAECYRALGRPREAWVQRVWALRRLTNSGGPVHNLLLDAALDAQEADLLRAAHALQGFGVERARRMGSGSRLVESLLWRSRISAALGRQMEAAKDLDLARAGLTEIADSELRRRMTAHLEEAAAHSLMPTDPLKALDRLDSALSFYGEMGYVLGTASALQDRAEARLLLGDRTGARGDLERSIQAYERHDLQPISELYRREHFERSQEAFERLIGLVLEDGENWEALALAERARLEAVRRVAAAERRVAAGTGRPVPTPVDGAALRRWARRQPDETVFLEYLVLPERLVTWRIAAGRLETWDQSRSRESVERLVEELERSLREPFSAGDFGALSGSLHDLLVAKALRGVPSGVPVVVVPDRVLSRVPFGALVQRDTGRYLIQDRSVISALSLSRSGVQLAPAVVGPVLVVGDPTGESGPPLPEARAEAHQVSVLYPGSLHFEGDAASRRLLLHHLPDVTLFHYAGHGVDDPYRPWMSHLVLASEPGTEESRLLARDLLTLDLSRLRLVVLAACSTASGRKQRAMPVSGLTLAFLEAGASSVVSTLWEVEDDGISPIIVSFHRHLALGLPPSKALRSAILEDLDTDGSPRFWAPLVLFQHTDSATSESSIWE